MQEIIAEFKFLCFILFITSAIKIKDNIEDEKLIPPLFEKKKKFVFNTVIADATKKFI